MSKMRKLTVDRSENKIYSRCQKKLSGVKNTIFDRCSEVSKNGCQIPLLQRGDLTDPHF